MTVRAATVASRAPPVIVSVPVPRAVALPMPSVPALTVTPPSKVLVPERFSRPKPVFARAEPVPPTAPESASVACGATTLKVPVAGRATVPASVRLLRPSNTTLPAGATALATLLAELPESSRAPSASASVPTPSGPLVIAPVELALM